MKRQALTPNATLPEVIAAAIAGDVESEGLWREQRSQSLRFESELSEISTDVRLLREELIRTRIVTALICGASGAFGAVTSAALQLALAKG